MVFRNMVVNTVAIVASSLAKIPGKRRITSVFVNIPRSSVMENVLMCVWSFIPISKTNLLRRVVHPLLTVVTKNTMTSNYMRLSLMSRLMKDAILMTLFVESRVIMMAMTAATF
jgi:hypothetical protein